MDASGVKVESSSTVEAHLTLSPLKPLSPYSRTHGNMSQKSWGKLRQIFLANNCNRCFSANLSTGPSDWTFNAGVTLKCNRQSCQAWWPLISDGQTVIIQLYLSTSLTFRPVRTTFSFLALLRSRNLCSGAKTELPFKLQMFSFSLLTFSPRCPFGPGLPGTSKHLCS